jgi:hypothetical protein
MVVFYTQAALSGAFLLCEGQVLCKASKIVTHELILLLIGAYFVLDRAYPKAFQCFLHFVAGEILGDSTQQNFRGSIGYNDFVKEYRKLS